MIVSRSHKLLFDICFISLLVTAFLILSIPDDLIKSISVDLRRTKKSYGSVEAIKNGDAA